jgi:tetratricopeptide (TPR) repeat protein
MSRLWIGVVFCAVAAAQQTPLPPDESKNAEPKEEVQLPPEEDQAATKPKEYKFNPLQSNKEMGPGEYYFKKGDYRAAAGRFREATKWNESNAQAWLRLGDAEERLKEPKEAREAYSKYLQLAPDAKNAAEIRRKLEQLKK